MTTRRKRRKRRRPSAAGRAAERVLQSHFDGRRDWTRFDIALDAALSNGIDRFRALTVNLSRTGALFALTDPVFLDAADTLLGYAARIDETFPDGIRVVFGDGVLTCPMGVVRVTLGGLGGRETPLLACHFACRLTAEQGMLLGLRPEQPA